MRPFSLVRRPARASTKAQRKFVRQMLCESLEQRALMAAAVFSVSNVNDNGPGSLRAAIESANSNAGPDSISFNLPAGPQTITLAQELVITDSVQITGPGSDQLTISGNHASRIFNVQELGTFEVRVDISGMKLTDGSAVDGGAVRNEFASIYMTDVFVSGNKATGNGGAFYTHGENSGGGNSFTLVLTNSAVFENTASGSGGAIYNDKDHVELHNTSVFRNEATLDGGAVFTQGDPSNIIIIGTASTNTLYVFDGSIIDNNTAGRNGGGIYAIDDHVEINASTVSNNTAGNDGGGIYSIATSSNPVPSSIDMFSSLVLNNQATGSGGGILIDSDRLSVFSSTVELNVAAVGGGILIRNNNGNQVFSDIRYSTIDNNSATNGVGGGLAIFKTIQSFGFAQQEIQLFSSTFSGNSSSAEGGGAYVSDLTDSNDYVEITFVTIADNDAATGGGLFAQGSGVVVQNTLIATNTAAVAPDAFGTFDFNNRFERSSRGNLVGIGNATDWPGPDNFVGTVASPIDPKIGPLKNNGGETRTHALLPGSPAIDAGWNSFEFSSDDQRGLERLGSVDIGAYEREFDFGDAPDTFQTSYFPAAETFSDGARHVLSGLFLGDLIDNESNGQPTAAANGDDENLFDDEDGVTFNFSSTAGFTGSATVRSSGAGLINAWSDVNGNGTWEANEQILTNVAVVQGDNLLTFRIPAPPAGTDPSINAVTRFRLSTQANLQSTGLAEDGEVEDYVLSINRVYLPDGTVGDGYVFKQLVPPRTRRSYDPELAYGYNYATNPATPGNPAGDKFTEVELLAGFGDDKYTIHLFNTTTGKYESAALAEVTAPAIVNFETGTIEDANGIRTDVFTGIAGGVDKFRVLGIELSAGLNPANPTAFPTLLAFGVTGTNTQSVVNFTMTPLATPVAVAESYTVLEDGLLAVSTVGLLANDHGPQQ